jgi:hypothetical protein
MLQVPITIVGGNLANGESLMILASSERQSQDTITSNALQESSNYTNAPFTSISPTVISISPHVTDTVYLNIDDSTGATGSYYINFTVKNVNTDAIYIHKQKLLYFVVEHTCSTAELQSCNKENCYAYVNPARTSMLYNKV